MYGKLIYLKQMLFKGVTMNNKVLIVDDEKLERVLIRKGYDWEANGFEIIGEAGSGEEALEFFDVKEPDIVITDINMPYMDGLQLAEKIRERSAKCRVVIVTGYREFEYARRALKLGVKDFILKPVNINDIANIVKNIKEELQEEEGHHREYNQLKETAKQNQSIVIESFLQLLAENRIEEKEALPKLEVYGFEGLLKECVCINIKPFKNQDGLMEENLATSKNILDFINDNYKINSISFIHYLCNIIIYLTDEDTKEAKTIANEIKKGINEELNMEVDVGISQIQHNYAGISKAYRQTEKAISASVILGRNLCITYDEYAGIKKANQGNTEINWQDFVFSVENCLEKKVEEYIDGYTNLIRKAGVTDTEYLKLMAMNMLSKAATVLTRHGKSLGQLVGDAWLYEEVSKITTVREMNGCLKNIINHILKYSDSLRTKKSNKLVDQALEYINSHLYEQSLTLKSVAGKVYTNESYLSRVFKQEMGEGLIEYINRKRIEQSMVLLNTTDLKAYEIAEKVGIGDPHYFSICFKKQVGVTIKEYKKPKYD